MVRVAAKALVVACTVAGCSPVAPPPTGERDDPRNFRVLALRDGSERFEDREASLICTVRVYCEPPSADCYCERYKLRAAQFSFEWSREAPAGAHLRSSDGNVIVRDSFGRTVSGELTITSRARVGSETMFFTDFAGTLAVETEDHTYSSGVFYGLSGT